MNNKAKDKVVVITGASAGIGRAITRLFAADGAKLGLIARERSRLEEAQKEAAEYKSEALLLPADVADASAIEDAAEAVMNHFGRIDIWINNAMTTVFSEFMDIKPDDYRRVTDVTYHGYVYGTQSAMRRMIPQNEGTIVQVGSALAYRGIPLQSAYCGAKHATEGFTESIRSEILHNNYNIYITMVQMPAVNTPQFNWCKSNFKKKPQPVPPIYQPEVAARAVYFAAFNRRREYYVGFNNTVILIGNKFFPGIGDRYLASKGYDGQFTDENAEPGRKFNLYEPVPGDYAARGDFTGRSKSSSIQFEISKQQYKLLAALAAVVIILLIINLF